MIVYTVITDGYDDIRPINIESKCRFIIVSDKVITIPDGWELKVVNNKNKLSSIEFNRYYKIHSYLLFGEEFDCIYIDANIEIMSDPMLLIDKCRKVNSEISMYLHPIRDNVKDEIISLKKLGYCYFSIANKCISRYRPSFLYQPFFEANIIYRRHSNSLNKMMNDWYYEFNKYIKRDQISFEYVCYKNQIRVLSLGIHDGRNENKFFRYHQHKKRKNASMSLKKKIVNKIFRIMRLDNVY